MCIKWIRENFNSEKNPQNEKIVCLDDRESIGESNIGDKSGFKKWYLDEFSKELDDECYKSLIKALK